MASSSLVLYVSNADTQEFVLVSSSVNMTVWKVANRPLSNPFTIELARKLTSGTKNDHVTVRIARVEANASTSQKATAQVLIDVSVPKDQSILTGAEISKMLGAAASLLNDGNNLALTGTNRGAIVDGRDV